MGEKNMGENKHGRKLCKTYGCNKDGWKRNIGGKETRVRKQR